MSHFTRVRTQLRDIDMVKRTLEDLGYDVTPGTVRGYGSQKTEADLVVKIQGGFDVGFRKEGEMVEMVGDFYGVKVNRDTFLQQVAQRYAYLTVVDQTTQQGWQIASEEKQKDGSVRLVMERWGSW